MKRFIKRGRLAGHWYVALFVGLMVMVGLWAFRFEIAPAEPEALVMFPVPQIAPPEDHSVDCSQTRCLALTFDDGPEPTFTPSILETLKRHNAKATFFVLGSHVKGNEDLLKRMHAEGHEIGNHSWNHPSFTKLSPEQIDQEIRTTQEAVIAADVPAPQLFRPPYGDMNDEVKAQIPLAIVRWNIDPEDWHPKHRQNILAHLAVHAKPGGVVVMHDTEQFTVDSLDQILTQLEANFTLVTVSELFGLTPGQRGVYFGR